MKEVGFQRLRPFPQKMSFGAACYAPPEMFQAGIDFASNLGVWDIEGNFFLTQTLVFAIISKHLSFTP
jgi:hypothetical protein